jgi:hemerythrin-like metal-binding protein
MENIEWTADYSVGVKQFDEEHKQLIKFINTLNSSILAGGAHYTMKEVLTSLVNYTKIHFRHEEDFMLIYDYPDKEKHKKEHDDLTKQVTEFYEEFLSGRSKITLSLLQFLRDWLVNHILGSDMKYKDFFISKNVNS